MEMYYWYDEAALCLSMAPFITPAKFTILSASKFEQCARVVVKCLDNWDAWKDEKELLMGTCSLSSSEDVTVYEFYPIEKDFSHYLIGSDKYAVNYCFPGTSPFYTPWEKYENNLWYANWSAIKQLTFMFKSAAAGLPSVNPSFEGPTVTSQRVLNLYENMEKAAHVSMQNLFKM